MEELGLVALLFVLVPGFVADRAYSQFRGQVELSETERVLRSLVFSVFGLSAYLVVGAGIAECVGALSRGAARAWPWIVTPPYINSLTANSANQPESSRISLDASALLALTWHIAWSMLLAVGWALLLNTQRAEAFVTQRSGRSLRGGGAWGALWSKVYTTDDAGQPLRGASLRKVSVALVDGSLILGDMQLVNDNPARDGRDIVLGNPLFYEPKARRLRAEGIRYLYVPGERVASVRLSAAGAEEVIRGYFNLDLTPIS
jgi:hypothetical protein